MDIVIYDPWASLTMYLITGALLIAACVALVGYGIYLLYKRTRK